jgi:hypothetical protein
MVDMRSPTRMRQRWRGHWAGMAPLVARPASYSSDGRGSVDLAAAVEVHALLMVETRGARRKRVG